jgi:phage terminase large subunit
VGRGSADAQPAFARPTIRTLGSKLWANWNPRRKSDAIDDFLRAKKPDNAIVVQANWRDNPWFADVHRHLEQARKDGRIGHVAVDPVLPVKAFFDIGGAGHSSVAMSRNSWGVKFDCSITLKASDSRSDITPPS